MNLECFFESQLKIWDQAQRNYEGLEKAITKPFSVGSLKGFVQYNPARAISTNAKTDKKDILKRPCFLCRQNRPETQISEEIIPGWEILLNPFPIFPRHFTIAYKEHTNQFFDINIAKRLAESLPGMVVFYNDDGAGASAPDHAHYQAVCKESLPLVNQIDSLSHSEANLKEFISGLPFRIILSENIKETVTDNFHPFNAFTWMNSSGNLMNIIIPRKKHRPDCFYFQPPFRRAISPGAVDMAGILITPFEDDFKLLTDHEIKEIYKQVAISND